MGKRKDLKTRKEAYRVGCVRTLEQFVCSRYSADSTSDFGIWLDRMTSLQLSLLHDTSITIPGEEPDDHPLISPRFLRTILLANIPGAYLAWIQPLLPSATWDEVTGVLKESWKASRPGSVMDKLPNEILREILLLALPDLDVLLEDPATVDTTLCLKPFQQSTIKSALKRQEAHVELRLICQRWNSVLGRPDHQAVKTITKAFSLTKLVREHPELEIAERTKVMTICAKDDVKNRYSSCERGKAVAELLLEFPNLQELHVGGPVLHESDGRSNQPTNMMLELSRMDRIVEGAATLKNLREVSFFRDDRNGGLVSGTLTYNAISSALSKWPKLSALHLGSLDSLRFSLPPNPDPPITLRLKELSIFIQTDPSVLLFRLLESSGALKSLKRLNISFVNVDELDVQIQTELCHVLLAISPRLEEITVSDCVGTSVTVQGALLPNATKARIITIGRSGCDWSFLGRLQNLHVLRHDWDNDFSWPALYQALIQRSGLLGAVEVAVNMRYVGKETLVNQRRRIRMVTRELWDEPATAALCAVLQSVCTILGSTSDGLSPSIIVEGNRFEENRG